LRYIAKARDDAIVDMLQAACEDLDAAYIRSLYTPDAAILMPTFAKQVVPKVVRQLEHLLKQNQSSSGYFVYEHPFFAEFHLYYLLYSLTHLKPNLLADCPSLAAWRETMNARPGIKAYETSGRRPSDGDIERFSE